MKSSAAVAKEKDPDLVIIFGGPNFPVLAEEKTEFLEKRSAIDFYIELEGEIGFVDLVRKLRACDFNINKFKEAGQTAQNTSYVYGGELRTGGIERIHDVNVIPSPYLTGILDEFFDLPLIPMLETTRGCPFLCSFW